MHYYEWNDLIGDLLFNTSKAGQPMFLYLTREQITQAAVSAGHFETEEEAWDCFTRRIRLVCRKKDIITAIKEFVTDNYGTYREHFNGQIYQTSYPRFISLLIVSVLPLTEDLLCDWSIANYYDRANKYLAENNLPQILTQDKAFNWNEAWASLEEWSCDFKRGTLGRFKAINANFNGHSYVGKPFSQCLIPPSALRDLPRAFVRAGWVPQQALTEQNWRSLLQQHCHDISFRQAALKTLLSNEGLQYALPIFQERYDRWDGTLHTAAAPIISGQRNASATRRESVRKEDTYARFYITFPDFNYTNECFCWQYRVKASQVLPDVLQLVGREFKAQLNNWSSAVEMAFQEGLQGYDTSNKWHVRWPDADVRLFESGRWHSLSSQVWVEVNELSRVNRMYAICKPSCKQTLRQWGTSFRAGGFKELVPDDDFDATGWPTGYGLFWFERPTQSIPHTRYTLPTAKQLEWVAGLKLEHNVFLNRHPPQLRLINGEGNELVTAFTEVGQQVELQQHADNLNVYIFSGTLPVGEPVVCRVANSSVTISCRFKNEDNAIHQEMYLAAPGRTAFGNATTADELKAYCGHTIYGVPENRSNFINLNRHVFYPASNSTRRLYTCVQAEWSPGDDLLAFLTCRGESQPIHFFNAYEALLARAVEQQTITLPDNISRSRRWALGWYDALGYVDYEYASGRIVALPPTLVPVPCQRGHRAILVGGRSPKLLERLQQEACRVGVTVSVEGQPEPTYLAPSIISLYADQSFYSKAYSPLYQIAQELNLPYLADELPAWQLLERSGSLTDYRATLQPEPEAETQTWTLRVFNPDKLHFERPLGSTLDTSFTLIERQLNAYQFVHYLWIDGQTYRVDKNWGRFLVLHYFGYQIIFKRNNHNQIAIPATLPLPRVLARGFTLLSGKIPIREEHNFDGTRRAYLLYENAGNILSDNYIRKLGQLIQSTNL